MGTAQDIFCLCAADLSIQRPEKDVVIHTSFSLAAARSTGLRSAFIARELQRTLSSMADALKFGLPRSSPCTLLFRHPIASHQCHVGSAVSPDVVYYRLSVLPKMLGTGHGNYGTGFIQGGRVEIC